MIKLFYFKQFDLVSVICTQFKCQTVLFNPYIGPYQEPGQSGSGNDGSEGVFRIPQSSSSVGASPSDCLVSYPGHFFGVRFLQR